MNTKTLILAVFLLALTSCGRSDMTLETPQEHIDSMVSVKVALIRSQIQKKNDSIINVLARQEADSIVKATKDQAMSNASKPKPVNNRPPINRQDTLKKSPAK